MLGDQLALAWVIMSDPSFDRRKFTKAQVFLEKIGGASVLFLPCAIYNWTPPEGAGQFHGMPLDVKVCCDVTTYDLDDQLNGIFLLRLGPARANWEKKKKREAEAVKHVLSHI